MLPHRCRCLRTRQHTMTCWTQQFQKWRSQRGAPTTIYPYLSNWFWSAAWLLQYQWWLKCQCWHNLWTIVSMHSKKWQYSSNLQQTLAHTNSNIHVSLTLVWIQQAGFFPALLHKGASASLAKPDILRSRTHLSLPNSVMTRSLRMMWMWPWDLFGVLWSGVR